MLWKCCTRYASKSGKLKQWPQDWKRSVFIPIPTKGNAKECSNYCKIALISHTSKVMLKILQVRLQQYVNFQMVKLDLEKAEEPEIKLPTSVRSMKKQESYIENKKHLLHWLHQSLCVHYNKLWKILKEIGIPDHLTRLLRNLFVCQEATVRTRQGTTNRFQIRKGACQSCILSPYLFNLNAEYIM